MFLALKCDFFSAEGQKNHTFSVSTILDFEDLILDTVRYNENVQDLDFISILDTIFSRLVATHHRVLSIRIISLLSEMIDKTPKGRHSQNTYTTYIFISFLELADHIISPVMRTKERTPRISCIFDAILFY